jgi:preprotein translocase subunit SecG
MGIIGVFLLVVFVIVCVLIVALVLIQNQDGNNLGGLFAGGSNSAFGSRSANVLTKTTYVVVTLFFVSAFFLALINKTPGDKGIQEAARAEQAATNTEWWSQDTAKDSASTATVSEDSTAPATDAAPATDQAPASK